LSHFFSAGKAIGATPHHLKVSFKLFVACFQAISAEELQLDVGSKITSVLSLC
jgi:hypothetical protein